MFLLLVVLVACGCFSTFIAWNEQNPYYFIPPLLILFTLFFTSVDWWLFLTAVLNVPIAYKLGKRWGQYIRKD